MPPLRTAIISLSRPLYTSKCASAPLHTCGSRSPPTQTTINHKRPARAQHSPHNNPVIRTIRLLSTTALLRAHELNHYEILDIPVTATAAEIKKQFYALSLRYHPDRNPTDPDAGQRFARISAAYHTLSNSTKRASYDREIGIHHVTHRAPGQHPMGSHSSYSANLHHKGGSYAGSRPASGLSKRRGAFRGPPPSFYAQGGYGATGRTGDGGHATAGSFSGSGGGAGATGQKQKGQAADPEDPMGFIERNPLGYFNARAHFRTQRAEDARRSERRTRAMRDADDEDVISGGGQIRVFKFVVVCGILVVAGAITGVAKRPSASTGDRASGSAQTRLRTEQRRNETAS